MASRGPGGSPPRGQHFLKSRGFAAELVQTAGISDGDFVLEIGAGRGKITEELSQRARAVLAIESDARLARLLIERFEGRPEVMVVWADALRFPPINERYRAFGNIPFGITSSLLRRLLLGPEMALERADLIVQHGAAMKRLCRRGNLLNSLWGPWWLLKIERVIPRHAFEPMPSVSAALLSIRKREVPMLKEEDRHPYEILVTTAFRDGREPKRALAELFPGRRHLMHSDTRAIDLDTSQWVELYQTLDSHDP
ncbi:MAG TPA: rRNA adenine N-6-methyltransferase family protein [Actinomycetota bacterium]|nr:rRNA adenine N-6-methyltransferase family protein [Actinomycetota bacterium]